MSDSREYSEFRREQTQNQELLWRLDERSVATQNLIAKLSEEMRVYQIENSARMQKINDQLQTQLQASADSLDKKITNALNKVEELENKVAKEYVKQAEWILVRNIVFGMVGIILITVFSAILVSVVPSGK